MQRRNFLKTMALGLAGVVGAVVGLPKKPEPELKGEIGRYAGWKFIGSDWGEGIMPLRIHNYTTGEWYPTLSTAASEAQVGDTIYICGND